MFFLHCRTDFYVVFLLFSSDLSNYIPKHSVDFNTWQEHKMDDPALLREANAQQTGISEEVMVRVQGVQPQNRGEPNTFEGSHLGDKIPNDVGLDQYTKIPTPQQSIYIYLRLG